MQVPLCPSSRLPAFLGVPLCMGMLCQVLCCVLSLQLLVCDPLETYLHWLGPNWTSSSEMVAALIDLAKSMSSCVLGKGVQICAWEPVGSGG